SNVYTSSVVKGCYSQTGITAGGPLGLTVLGSTLGGPVSVGVAAPGGCSVRILDSGIVGGVPVAADLTRSLSTADPLTFEVLGCVQVDAGETQLSRIPDQRGLIYPQLDFASNLHAVQSILVQAAKAAGNPAAALNSWHDGSLPRHS